MTAFLYQRSLIMAARSRAQGSKLKQLCGMRVPVCGSELLADECRSRFRNPRSGVAFSSNAVDLLARRQSDRAGRAGGRAGAGLRSVRTTAVAGELDAARERQWRPGRALLRMQILRPHG